MNEGAHQDEISPEAPETQAGGVPTPEEYMKRIQKIAEGMRESGIMSLGDFDAMPLSNHYPEDYDENLLASMRKNSDVFAKKIQAVLGE